MAVIGSVDAVIATIGAEADAEGERLRAHADEEIAALRELPADSDPIAREARLNEARRRNDELEAQMDWEERRRVIEQREEWIARVVGRGDELLRSATIDDRKRSLNVVVGEALQNIRGEGTEIRVSERDRALVDLPQGATLGENAPIRGGCIVRCGALVFDNSFEQRAKRLEPVWRKALSGMYRV
ncbi:MAG: hypothetical protein ACXVH7_00765 [Thermoanaerobaculia bacterium]